MLFKTGDGAIAKWVVTTPPFETGDGAIAKWVVTTPPFETGDGAIAKWVVTTPRFKTGDGAIAKWVVTTPPFETGDGAIAKWVVTGHDTAVLNGVWRRCVRQHGHKTLTLFEGRKVRPGLKALRNLSAEGMEC